MPDGQNSSIAKAFDCNVIEQVTVSSLLDDRYFFIPSYQRGYRWTKQQVYDLCNDLLEYSLQPNKKPESFYSLQPLIVRMGKYIINGEERDAYEVIDGQQRLTTVFLLYRFLAKGMRYRNLDEVSDDLSDKKLYHIFYETRKGDYETLEKSGFEELTNNDIKDIDIAHIHNALHYMKCWIDNTKETDTDCAEALCHIYGERFDKKSVKEKLFNLLNDQNSQQLGSVQFIWYEIDGEKDAIKEFLTENKGKIHLTDCEKIRALFMQRRSINNNDVKDLKQLSIAKDWELVENTLHRNDFWSFISNDIFMEDGRISIIFQYIFENDSVSKDINQEGDYLFRYYYPKLAKNSLKESSIEKNVDCLWKQVMDCFRMLQNWYYNPKIYNLVGLLVKHGYSIREIGKIYNDENIKTHEDFIYALNKKILELIINEIPISNDGNKDLDIPEGEEYIHLFFDNSKEKKLIPDLLRFINIREMNKTIDEALSEIDKDATEKKKSDINRSARDVVSHIYRFPFEALDVFGWDIEHIDSATTNSLTNPNEQLDWLKEAEKTIEKTLLGDSTYKSLKDKYDETEDNDLLKSMVNRVYDIVEEDSSEIRKNWIGNLTLLDSGTNRSYKNKIFAWKKNILQSRISAGVFVPICTQNIFYKTIPGASSSNWKYNHQDKKAYHAYILKGIKQFKEKYADKQEVNEESTENN